MKSRFQSNTAIEPTKSAYIPYHVNEDEYTTRPAYARVAKHSLIPTTS